MNIVTNNNILALDEANDFQENSGYSDLMCGKFIKNLGTTTIDTALENLEYVGITKKDIEFYRHFQDLHSKALCFLPVGHRGPCEQHPTKWFEKEIGNKLSDCRTTAGDDDIIFKNRGWRYFPIQIDSDTETKLKLEYQLKSNNIKLKAAVPLKFGATGFLVATAYFDMVSILMFQHGINLNKFPSHLIDSFREHGKRVFKKFNKNTNFRMIKDDKFLCDPLFGKTFELSFYNKLERKPDDAVEFGHINPVRDHKYMTRGGNIFLISRCSNLIQSDTDFKNVWESKIRPITDNHNQITL
tara:strand:- start:541 stop:1437 length:897 start_codon:yes stop_codon:yes gene_type:complete